ncbi:Phenylalanine--tRNA ligase beta subunit [Gracilariopsis chorda]|uniref:phenylalanine--tRNA ligase n=1 Tax=Gracilariopsis chorda TaxID=448386 RepID=A0A2V3IYQ4_9FLOR|nr:Phenylalanine--tRNA ligase beta subunit [Gracilariopsis chorda]|eukprot:PXF47193.1 Phenylalanine--tRNA ligase beta subunit [Gracilariopsis chorda]
MPTVSVSRDRLFEELGQTFTREEFDDLCFEFGLELDDVVSEKPQIGSKALSAGIDVEEEIRYKIEVPANRYDLLCVEGLSQALRVFMGYDAAVPDYQLDGEPKFTFTVAEEVAQVRPYVFCAVLRNLQMDDAIYQSLIDLQDKLHQNICRRRTLVAIGTHDLDTLTGPFSYEALPPKHISFIPLAKTDEYDAEQLMELYEDDVRLKKYLGIIRDCPRYPVIYDSNRTVLSMPPIINGDHSKITLNTTNMLIECTATDKTKASIVLNTLVAMFSRYCERPYTVEPVRVQYADGTTMITPDLSMPKVNADVNYINRLVGVHLAPKDMVSMLSRMQLPATVIDDKTIGVDVPIIRSDVLHACDVMCDVAVGYGFNRVPERVPETSTVGKQLPLNHLSDMIRREGLAQQGYTEVLTWVTVSNAENFGSLRREDDGSIAVKIGNPKTLEFEECRTSLITGLLKTLRENRNAKVPIRLFEVGDVVLKDEQTEVLARNKRKVAAVYCAPSAGFEVIQGLLENVLSTLGVKRGDGDEKGTWSLDAENCSDGTFFEGRRANIVYGGVVIGVIGWIHPEVLSNFSLSYPCSAIEFDLEDFL